MLFTDSYGEQSCTAGRSSFITGQSVLRTGLSKVGIPGAPVGMNDKLVTIAALLKEQGYATGQFGKNHLGDLNHMLPTNHGFDEFFGNLYHLNAEEEPEMYDYYPDKDFPNFKKKNGPRGVIHSWATDVDDPTEQPRWGKVGKQKIEDTGPLTASADGDLRRRVRRAATGFIKKPAGRRQAVLRLAEHHPHAPVHPHQAREPGPGRALAVALSRHHDRPRQERRPDAGPARRAGPGRGHHRGLLDRQRPAPQQLAGRRHDAVPQREGHQLGRRLPHSRGDPLAGQDQGRQRSPTRSSSTTTGCRPSWPWPASRTSSRRSRRASPPPAGTYKNHIDG
jgi:hypothetical protein